MDEKLYEKLSAYVDGALDSVDAREVQEELSRNPAAASFVQSCKMLDRETATLPVPELVPDVAEELWKCILEDTIDRKLNAATLRSELNWRSLAQELVEPPAVSADRWAQGWSAISARTTEIKSQKNVNAGTSSVSNSNSAPLEADFSPAGLKAVSQLDTAATFKKRKYEKSTSIWSAVGMMTAAAALLFLVASTFLKESVPAPGSITPARVAASPSVSKRASRVYDERYLMNVRYIAGLDQPVTSFILTEEEEAEE